MFVTFLGPPGTYSHQVALGVYPSGVVQTSGVATSSSSSSSSSSLEGIELVACPTITSTIQQAHTLSKSQSHTPTQALLPLSNSTFGPVKETYSLLDLSLDCSSTDDIEEGQEYDVRCGDADDTDSAGGDRVRVRVVKKIVNSIEHSLLVHQSTWDACRGGDANELPLDSLRRITEVRSHEQALGQCSSFLSTYLPSAQQVKTSSTAAGAASLTAASPRTVAAIASSICATHGIYSGLRVARRDVQDRSDNRTTFLLVEIVRDT